MASQVAAVWVDEEPVDSVRVHDNFSINYCYGFYDPLQYPLLFPYGDNGWHLGIRKNSNHKNVHYVAHDTVIDARGVNSIDELLSQENLGNF